MKSFEFYVPCDVLFGAGKEEELPAKLAAYGKKVLLTYGGGSIKKSGLYDKIIGMLKDFEVFELDGVEPNPRVTTVNKGAEICKKEGIDMILAVGGGSTIDCSKAIAAAAFYDGDAWDLLTGKGQITKALPVAVVLTIAATGSEMDCAAVISNMETNEKLLMGHPLLLPKVAVLNPENTYSVPPYQTASGSADMMSHVIESYFDREPAFVPDAISEGLLRAAIKYTPIALEDPENYEARAQLLWTSSLALNGLVTTGKNFMWSCHYIEHELSAHYDITHGAGLAVLTPKWMRYILSEDTVDKFCDYAVNVWGIAGEEDRFALANKGIDATEAFFRRIGLPSSLKEFGIDDAKFPQMAAKAVQVGCLGQAYVPLKEEDVVKILNMCL
ncbi:iron-containing alcohol dehydrogenase [Clostridium sp. MCC353]|uniref:iron-containing alcohol dehydrogenase n=1 Tax=Clostridium sp. MCC353 TaxID=2592646 RepID=UPI001C021521|nr:iron-containing alcohol dehydrogenase [Clostridium sp. MCC353]MBT9779644.1 iron-containing alcohol dehydrogenase [Clostridium sp. MCC353]